MSRYSLEGKTITLGFSPGAASAKRGVSTEEYRHEVYPNTDDNRATKGLMDFALSKAADLKVTDLTNNIIILLVGSRPTTSRQTFSSKRRKQYTVGHSKLLILFGVGIKFRSTYERFGYIGDLEVLLKTLIFSIFSNESKVPLFKSYSYKT